MTLIPQNFLKQVASGYGVSDTEFEVLSKALLEGESIATIATQLKLKPETVRKRLGETYRKFQISGKGPGKMAKLQQLLVALYQEQTQSEEFLSRSAEPTNLISCQDWNAAPDVETFYGRSEELSQLNQWILSDRCRLVALLGMGGMGKTTLAVKLAKQNAGKFDFVIWRSLRQGMSLGSILSDFIQFLSPQSLSNFEEIEVGISQLMEILRSNRCLLVLDDVEMILSCQDLAGYYADGFTDYGKFIQRIAEEPHQSCLILATSEKLKDLGQLEGQKVRSLQVVGSEEISQKILAERGFVVSQNWVSLIERYGCNPLAVKIISGMVQELYAGQVGDFIKNTLLMGDVRSLLDQPFQRLSLAEKELMYWLALEQQPINLSQLQEKILLPLSASELLETVGSLGRRSLIEKSQKQGQTYFSLQPVVMKYAIEQFVRQVDEELVGLIKNQDLSGIRLLKLYPLESSENSNKHYSILDLVMNRLRSRLFTNTRGLNLAIKRLEESLSNLQEEFFEGEYITQNLENVINAIQ
ncbi:MAG: NACHT domain-containing protein [Okeania sp. SIO3I5]|uniref:NB-ARC domain-containing protein n=1 Tax=Okeania sp. SIO3I5 TaxID=2607805 RepID=UPI0013BA2FCE|nr:NB-ARC domain-containing protein [Okeania sp. SIO3I5]NEQ39346.1 NACHT domain-containing protein [Okeania sp. SIO3I5]